MNGTQHTTLAGLAVDIHGTSDARRPIVLLHGLSYDRRQWGPLLDELDAVDPGRLVLAVDLPGHGGSARRPTYHLDEVAGQVHEAATEAGFDTPVVVGHSLGGALATVYAAAHPAVAVVNIDQPLLVGPFRDVLLQAEPVLRSPAFGEVWDMMLQGMRTDLLPPAARELASTATTPRQDLLLGYWDEVLTTPADVLAEERTRDMGAIRDRGIAYHHVSGEELPAAYRTWLETVQPDATVTVIPGSGHFPHLARPREVAKILAAY
ncbi:alpha/beta hydrolase [Streptomyces camponoticapitis]|uniref:Alpha/beta hydrolase n=1 Tax=Streptomyces camponoticapitis TaxID=1616125 RepID=A0ABQ2ER53_9ACTN|nr:alpha/beta hydrolase [Streptomyces camponoticapitis]GGK21761.1 alpha/beta hydrolase [Streptomyces camponoticapitis]